MRHLTAFETHRHAEATEFGSKTKTILKEHQEEATKLIKVAEITLLEAAMLQILRDTKYVVGVRAIKIQSQMDLLNDSKLGLAFRERSRARAITFAITVPITAVQIAAAGGSLLFTRTIMIRARRSMALAACGVVLV